MISRRQQIAIQGLRTMRKAIFLVITPSNEYSICSSRGEEGVFSLVQGARTVELAGEWDWDNPTND